jgi:hypothetical protein
MARRDDRIDLEGLLDEDIAELPPERVVAAFTALRQRLLADEEIIDRLNLTVQALLATLEEHGSWDPDYYRKALASHDILDGKWDGKLGSDRVDLED